MSRRRLVLVALLLLPTLVLLDVSGAARRPESALPAPIRVPGAKGPVKWVTCATLQRALDRLRAGETVIVAGGPCPGQYSVVDRHLARPAEVRGVAGRRTVFTGGAGTGYPALYVSDSTNVVIGRNLEVVNASGPCVAVEKARNVRILGARIHDCAGQGILIQSGAQGTSSRNVQVDRNELWNIGSAAAGLEHGVGDDGASTSETGYWRYGTHAIYYGGGRGATLGGGVWNNLIHDQPTGYGIQVGGGARGTIVAANTIRRVTRDPRRDSPPTAPGRAGACIQLFSSFYGTSDVMVVNNVCTEPATRGIAGACSCPSLGSVHNNVVWNHGLSPAVDGTYGGATVLRVGVNWRIDPELGQDNRPHRRSPLVGRADPRYLPAVDILGQVRTSPTIGAFTPR